MSQATAATITIDAEYFLLLSEVAFLSESHFEDYPPRGRRQKAIAEALEKIKKHQAVRRIEING